MILAPKPKPAEAQDWGFDPISRDPLLTAMAQCMLLNGRDVGTDTLLAGLPLPLDGRLTPPLAVQAAETQGFRAKLSRQALDRIASELLPCVLFLKGRGACVLVGKDRDTARIIRPESSEDPQDVALTDLTKEFDGHVLLLREDPDAADASTPEPTPMPRHWFWSAARQYWPEYSQVILASVVVNILALATPIFTMTVYDRVFPNAALITLWSLVAGIALAMVFDGILKWVRAGVVDRVGRSVDQAVSSTLFRHISDLRLDDRSVPTGAMINTLKDYEQVRDFFSSQTVATLTDFCFGLFFVAVIYYIGGPLAYPPAIAYVLVLVFGLVILWPLRAASDKARQTTGNKNAVAVEAVSELETLKSIAGQGRMQARWERQVADSGAAVEHSKKLATFATTMTGLAQQASSVGIIVIGVYLALEGQVTMGAVIASMILSGRALAPTAAVASLFVRAGFAFSTLKSLNQLMARPSDAQPRKNAINASLDTGAYQLDGVGLSYPDATLPSLTDVSLRIAGQERIGVIGAVGAGKTSLVRLLAGLLHPSTGIVLLDGLNIDQLSPARVRSQVQLVPQDAVLFSGTLAENIAFGATAVSGDEIMRAARAAGVDQFAAQHPEGFSMPIAERGRNLSGGQRQMVALARALLANPRVLILDEPTSSMDTQTEAIFIRRLGQILTERPMTLIVSTHRMGLLSLVDRLILLDKGKIRADDDKQTVLKTLSTQPSGVGA